MREHASRQKTNNPLQDRDLVLDLDTANISGETKPSRPHI